MSKPEPQPDERHSEELVAYLDGELSASESESVELRIRQDEFTRKELQKFDRVWNALDDLERVTLDDSFTRTTIEMASVEARKELAQETALLPVRRRNRWIKLVSLAAAAALAGFAALAALMPNSNRQLYTHLPVILELDAYSEVRDIEFLRLLNAQSGDWLLAEWGEEVEPDSAALAELTSASYRDRRQYVDQLTTDERTDLAAKHRRYQSLTPEMRKELTAWHTNLSTDPDAAALQKTMLAYYAWVSQANEADQAGLRAMAPADRVERVERMQRESQRRSEMQLSPANIAAMRKAVDAMAMDPDMKKLHATMISSLPNLDKLSTPENRRDHRIESLRALKQSNPRIAILMIEMGSGFGREPPFSNFTDYRDAIEHRLIEALDTETAERLTNMKQRERSRMLAMWLMMSSRRQKNPDVATLEEYFVSGNLSPEEQQRLLALPTKEKMLGELERLYIEEFLGDGSDEREFREMMQNFGFGRGGRFGGRGNWRDKRRPDGRGPGRPAEGRPPGPPPGDRPPPPMGTDDFGPPR